MSDIQIAQNAPIKPISEIAAKLDIPIDALAPFGHTKAKVSLKFIESLAARPDGKLILVTAITPTPAGEGKTTTSVGLTDGLNKLGKKAMVCLREPSLGPCFGMKGGAAGGGYAQVIPMEDINLHFTGDFHAITSAHSLLSALIDNHIYWGNEAGIDTRRVAWRRVVDMNDRALRHITSSLGGVANGYPREDGFDITVASEVMAIFCLARDAKDLEERLGRIVIGYTRERAPVRADAVLAPGPMTVLLEGRHRAESGADPRTQSGVHPRRAVRQHRPRLQLGHRHPRRVETRGLRGHRSRLRRRPRCGKILRHKMSQRRPCAGCGGAGGHRARVENARRCFQR